MKVTVLVGGRFFAFDIARELQRQEMLAGVVTAYGRAPREGIGWTRLRWNPLVEAVSRWERRRGRIPDPEIDFRASSRFGRWAARNLPRCDVLQGWTGYTLESIPVAQARGTTVMATRASAHIRTQAELLEAEYGAFGFPAAPVSPRMIERECEEYERADYVQVFSTFALKSFLERGFARERMVLTPLGVDMAEVAPAGEGPAPRRDGEGPLRVLYLGQVGLRKGAHYLLDAAKRLGPEAVSVSLVGGLAPEGELLLRRHAAGDEWKGKVPRSELRRVFAEHDVLILPSVEDGFGAVVCEAMAAGLPVIATTSTGGPDVIDDGRTGVIIPPASVDAIAESLAAFADDRERCREMGRAAAEAMRTTRTWRQFVDDMVAQYGAARARRVTGADGCAS